MANPILASTDNTCDITLKHVLLSKLNLWQNPAQKSQQILSRFLGYHNVARTVVILNVSVFGILIAKGEKGTKLK